MLVRSLIDSMPRDFPIGKQSKVLRTYRSRKVSKHMAIEVGGKVKEIVNKHALAAHKKLGLDEGEFTQDANAIAVYNSLRELGIIPDGLEKEQVGEALQALKKGGNTSALRQAIFSDKGTKESKLASEVLGLCD